MTVPEHEQLIRLHVDVLRDLGSHTCLCRYEPADLEAIRSLPFVTYANVFHQDLVVHPDMRAGNTPSQPQPSVTGTSPEQGGTDEHKTALKTQDGNTRKYIVHVGLYPKSGMDSRELKRRVVELLGILPERITEDKDSVMLEVSLEDMTQIARLDEVHEIVELQDMVFDNYIARSDIKLIDPPGDAPYPLFTYLDQNGKEITVKTPEGGYTGSGETVAVTDSGFDKGLTDKTMLKAFKNRIAKLYNINRADGTLDDKIAHGTHVCGTIAATGKPTIDPNYKDINISGTAPKAQLYVGVVEVSKIDKVPFTKVLKEPFDESVSKPPRIFNCSWGHDTAYPYDDKVGIIDTLIYENPEMMVVVAAGNKGHGFSTPKPTPMIGGTRAVKNILTVGSCETTHKLNKNWDPKENKIRYSVDTTSSRGEGQVVCSFSSIGPTPEGRIKPDVVAPGANLLSAFSQGKTSTTAWPNGQPYSFFGTCTDPEWVFCGGTSMSAPAVSGALAVLRQAYTKVRGGAPSAAELKALIINGARDLSKETQPIQTTNLGGHEYKPAPDSVQGFGRVDIQKSLQNLLDTYHGGMFTYGRGAFAALKQGDTPGKKPLPIPPGNVDPTTNVQNGITLSATLVWTDPPGKDLQNEFSLRVEKEDKSEFKYGNTYKTANTPDKTNNVQKVVWESIQEGNYNVFVEINKITGPAENTAKATVAWYWEEHPPLSSSSGT